MGVLTRNGIRLSRIEPGAVPTRFRGKARYPFECHGYATVSRRHTHREVVSHRLPPEQWLGYAPTALLARVVCALEGPSPRCRGKRSAQGAILLAKEASGSRPGPVGGVVYRALSPSTAARPDRFIERGVRESSYGDNRGVNDVLKAVSTTTILLVSCLLWATTAAAAGPGGHGRLHPGAQLPHAGLWRPFYRFHYPPFPIYPYSWRGPVIWYPPPSPSPYWFGQPRPGYGRPPSSSTRERCYHYFGQRYCVGSSYDGGPPAAEQPDREPAFGTGPRLFNGN